MDKLTDIEFCKEEETISEKGCDTCNGAPISPMIVVLNVQVK